MKKSQLEGRPISCILTSDNRSEVVGRIAGLFVNFSSGIA